METCGATFDADAFVRAVLDKTAATVGEQVTVTVYLYLRGTLNSAPAIRKSRVRPD